MIQAMQFKYTSHQVARSARPDAETIDKFYLIKNVLLLRATYQIKVLMLKAVEKRKKLIIKVPSRCKFHKSLRELIKTIGSTVKREEL